ncbi:multidrug-resistance type transporter aminotriazole resistance [Lecanora helva]
MTDEESQPASAPQDAYPDDKEYGSDDSRNQASEGQADLSKVDTNKSIAEKISLGREILFIGVICCAQLTTQAGLGQCLDILQVIGDSYGLTNPGELSWLIAAYSLTVGTFILIAGRLGDVYGYKRMLLIGFSWFSLWSMIAGLAVYSNHVLFNFARVFQGMGPALILPNGLAILGASYAPGPRKAMVFGLFGGCAPGGAIIGAAFAGLFSLAWWPWTFWSFAIALACITLVGSWAIPDPPKKASTPKSLREAINELDLLGGFCGVTALVLINFAWNQSGVVGWQKAYVYVCLILGFLFVPLFFYIELRLSTSPLIPFDVLSSDVAFVLGCVACGWSCFGIWVFYIWEFFEILRGATPLQAAAWSSPVAISGMLASIATGFLLGRLKPAWVMTIALTAFITGTILITTAPVDQMYWKQSFVCLVIIPWGMDMSFPAATLILSNAVSKKHQGIAASLVITIVNYSISLSLGFAGTIDSHVNNGGRTPEDILKGFRGAWYLAIGLAGLGLFLSLTFLCKQYWKGGDKPSEKKEEPA